MAKKKNLSEVTQVHLREPGRVRIAVVTSSWNPEVTGVLEQGAVAYLSEQGITPGNILVEKVPGSYELPLAARLMLNRGDIDGVVCLGCIIQGETRHFEFIAQAVAHGIMEVNLQATAPVSFGVLT
ncbi:MAG TPA: 6,7-dimethyl-8-ribityllumazine synthase, partial [Bacteroidales bacterium]|nr:6,7-dimethyl-8-ribityllumazine synthase [Bacteroidales bacterium]